MKRLFSLLFALVLVLAISPAAYADAIYIPSDDFYEDHAVYCNKLEQAFSTLCEVKLYQSPANSTVKATLPEDAYVNVMYTWRDGLGREWGYTEFNDAEVRGWLPMAYLGDYDRDNTSAKQELPRYEIKPGFTPARVITGGGVALCIVVTALILLKRRKEEKK